MIKDKKDENSISENESVTSILVDDKKNISEATEKAKINIDSVAYADNLPKPKTDSTNKKVNTINENNENIINNDNNSSLHNKDDKKSKKLSKKTIIILSCVTLFIILLFFIFSVIFALVVGNQSTIIQGIKIQDIDVSGLSKEAAIEKVSSTFSEKLSKSFTLKHNDYELTVFPEQFAISFDIEGAVNTAFLKGRHGNIFENNFEILSALFFNININPGFSYNESSFSSLISEMENNFPDKFIESDYYIEGDCLILTKGSNGIVIDSEALKTNIIYFIHNFDTNSPIIPIPVINKTVSPLDLNKIRQEIYHEPENAYYTTNPYVVHPQVDGIDFGIDMEEATDILNDAQDECTIPLSITEPAVTTNDIGSEAFPDLLGDYSTTFSTSNTSRSTNIRLAAEKIDGIVVMPGEIFSYNQTVGQRTSAAGFKSAAVYSGGEVTTGIGGGICQVSSTLYNAVLYANLDIVERQNHGFNTGYVPAGRDATVSWGSPDFKFQNNRDYPVKVACEVSGGTIRARIWGLLMEDEPEVEIDSYVTGTIAYKTITQYDSSLPTGATKVIQSGSNGCRAVCYRILRLNGEVISKELISQDTYNPHNKIIAVGD